MTKEELEKEAEEYANNLTFVFETDIVQRIVRERVRLALIDVLEPREKRIAELEKENERLTDELKALRESIKDYGAGCYENGLRNGKRKLEAQIEKMKCCGNCEFGCIACGNYLCELLLNNCNSIPFHCDKWEIKEK